MPSQNQQIVKKYFDPTDSEHLWKCKCGKKLIQKKGSGWTNLLNHIKSQHPEYSTMKEIKQQSLSSFTSIPSTSSSVNCSALNVYGWIEWVCVGLKPFSFIEESLTRKYTSLGSMTNLTLKMYMEKLIQIVKNKISYELPDKFSLVIERWTKESTHFIGLCASYPYNNQKGYRTIFLAFSPLLSEISSTASDYVEFIKYVLSLFNKNLENVVAITGDNAEVNKFIANLCSIPLIGCANHKFNLAVSAYLDKKKILLDKINMLMGKLKSLKLAGRLQKQTEFQPIQRNRARWSTSHDMIKRIIQLKPFLESFQDDPKLVDCLLTPRDHNDLQTLEDNLKKLSSVTTALQREKLDLWDVRVLFDEILALYPHDEFQKYLSASAAIVQKPHFENGVVKILQHAETELTPNEVASLQKLRVAIQTDVSQSQIPVENDDFASICLKKRKTNKVSIQEYSDCRFLLPTSNILERFFNSAGESFNDYWQHLLPRNLEMQLFLKVNRDFWNKEAVFKICKH